MSESPVFEYPADDPTMEEAGKKARQTFRYFWRELTWERRRIVPGLELAAVKATFTDPPEIREQNPDGLEKEHMWLLDVDFDGRNLTGTLINQPASLQSVSEGDQVSLKGRQIFDWMYVQLGNVYGGFTVDLMRARMSKSERKAHDNAWGFDFGEVGLVDLVPMSYIGMEERKKGFMGFGKSKPEPQDYAKVAAAEHPMSVNMRSSLDEALTANPGMLHEPDEKGYNFLHNLALGGSYDGVDVCLNHGADPNAKAPNGMTPMLLAKSLGWNRVMQRLAQAGGVE